jgi:REP element-mobilizing transposase RayT
MPDHIHLILKYPSILSVAEIVKKAKGGSSRLINQTLKVDELFRWQAGYAAYTVSRWDLQKIIEYVNNQKKNHAEGILYSELETIFVD